MGSAMVGSPRLLGTGPLCKTHPGARRAHLCWVKRTRRNPPEVGGLLGELGGHQGEVLAHLDPEVGLGDAAVVGVDGMDTGHLPGDHPESTHT